MTVAKYEKAGWRKPYEVKPLKVGDEVVLGEGSNFDASRDSVVTFGTTYKSVLTVGTPDAVKVVNQMTVYSFKPPEVLQPKVLRLRRGEINSQHFEVEPTLLDMITGHRVKIRWTPDRK